MAKTKKDTADLAKLYQTSVVDPRKLVKAVGFWPTGSLALDKRLGGGFPMGKMVELYGPAYGGKSTLAQKVCGLALAEGATVDYNDLEQGLDVGNADNWDEEGLIAPAASEMQRASRTSWLQRNGVDIYNPNFRIREPSNGEEMFSLIEYAIRNHLVDLIVVDSVPAILPKVMLEAKAGEATYGARAKLLAEQLPRLVDAYRKTPEARTTVIFINQVRELIGAKVKMQKSTGGFALEHYCHVKVNVRRIGKGGEDENFVSQVRARVEKNRYAPPGDAYFFISAARGVDLISELLPVGVTLGYIHKQGNWHYFYERPVDDSVFKTAAAKKTMKEIPGFIGAQNGEDAAKAWMAGAGWQDKLLPEARKLFGRG